MAAHAWDDRAGTAEPVDALEARVRRDGGGGRPRGGRAQVGARGRCRGSTRSPPRPRPGRRSCSTALVAEAEAIWAAPHARRADVLDPEERDEARVAAALRSAAAELRGSLRPGAAGRRRGGARDARRRSRCGQGDDDRAASCSPTRSMIRARRFRAVFVCGLQDGEFPQPPGARAVPRRRGAARAERGGRAAAAVPRGRARPRALAVLRLRLAPAGGAVPVLALVRRGGRAARRVAVPRRRARAVHRRAVGAARAAAAGRGDVVAARGADAARAPARPGGGAQRARPAAAAGAGQRAGARAARRAADRGRARSSRRSRPAGCAGWSRRCCTRRG